MSLEAMHYVIGLPLSEFPYEEYIPYKEVLPLLKANEPELFET